MNNKEGNNKKAVLDQQVLDLARTSQTCDAKKKAQKK
jgi:hypothetical protein